MRRSRGSRSCASSTRRCGAAGRSCARYGKTPGLFAVSRIGSDGREIVVAFNTSMQTVVAQIEVEAGLERVQDAARRLCRQGQRARQFPGRSAAVELRGLAREWRSEARVLLAARCCAARALAANVAVARPRGVTVRSPDGKLVGHAARERRRPAGIFHRARRPASSSTGRGSVSSSRMRPSSSATSRSAGVEQKAHRRHLGAALGRAPLRSQSLHRTCA